MITAAENNLPNVDAELPRELKIFRVLRLTVMAFGVIWALLSIGFGAHWLLLAALFAIGGSLFAAWLNALGRDLAARSAWLLTTNLAVFSGALLVHPSGHIEYILFTGVGVPLLVFSWEREQFPLIVCSVLPILLWLGLWLIGPMPLGFHDVQAAQAKGVIALASAVTTFVVIGLELAYFAAITRAEKRKLKQALARAEVANETKSAFLANMSHEIRTPLNAVLGMAELAAIETTQPAVRDYLKHIDSAGSNLLRILNDILDLSQIEADKMALEMRPFALTECIEEAVGLMQTQAAEAGLGLRMEFDEAIPECVEGDALRIRQIVLNLLSNAIKFTESGGVTITAAWVEGSATVRVIDSGIGIEPDHLQRLFSAFEQADVSSTRRFGGTGLGLAISRRLATLMGGELDATSEVGQGSTFRLVLPLPSQSPALDWPSSD